MKMDSMAGKLPLKFGLKDQICRICMHRFGQLIMPDSLVFLESTGFYQLEKKADICEYFLALENYALVTFC